VSHNGFETPLAAINAWCENLARVPTEQVDLADAVGRVLAVPLLTDRDSPPCDVSAMDGYAVRLQDLPATSLPVAKTARIGQRAEALDPGTAVKIVTGAAVPVGAQAVIRREDTREFPGRVELIGRPPEMGENIRVQGENLRQGQEVLPAGAMITPATIASLATFGVTRPTVYRKLNVGIITTGDELLPPEGSPAPWQIRDSNGPFLQALVSASPRLNLHSITRAPDRPDAIADCLQQALDTCDLVFLTGGVSMGDRDYVPATVTGAGARIIFHRLPIRPGHPILGAVGSKGQCIMGLPGNPLAVMTGACRFGRAAVDRLSGLVRAPAPLLPLAEADAKTLKLWWYRPVSVGEDGAARLVSSRGSGDIPSAARGDGFIEVPPHSSGAGPWPFYRWEI
jgi:molybdopterin molybdotransferase